MPRLRLATRLPAYFTPGQVAVLAAGVAATAVAGGAVAAGTGEVARFVLAGVALAALAAAIGLGVEALAEHLSAGATGLVQSALGNLPELLVGVFALRDGLVGVVRAALVGSVLGGALLVLGCAFVAGGLRHGPQRFEPQEPRLNATLLLLAVGALVVPTLAAHLSTPAAAHTGTLSDACAAVLLAVYACTIPYYFRRQAATPPAATPPAATPPAATPPAATEVGSAGEASTVRWPVLPSLAILAVASVAAGAASDWFVGALQPAALSLGLSDTFTGLVIVAVASNAVEHAVGIRFALKGRPELAVSTTLNSPLQVALLLTPALVLASTWVGPSRLTLVFPLLLVASLAVAAPLVVIAVVFDGEYLWIEGVALIALYVMIAAGFWWG